MRTIGQACDGRSMYPMLATRFAIVLHIGMITTEEVHGESDGLAEIVLTI